MRRAARLVLAALAGAMLLATLVPAAGVAAAPPLSVRAAGNRLVDGSGQVIRLLGVNRSGTEFKCIQGGSPTNRGWGLFDGPIDATAADAIASWHANVVRIPLNEDCWLGINGVNPSWGGETYQRQVAALVRTLNAAGLFVVLDLHWNAPGGFPALSQQPMPDADHSVQLWRSVAETFRDNQSVVFDLYNEPFIYGSYMADPSGDPWQCWRDGCSLTQHLSGSGNPYTLPGQWRAAGMQTLVTTVRQTGARNLIMAGGLDWANDMSGWQSHAPRDPASNLAMSWHSYPGQSCSPRSCWEKSVAPAAARYPVIVGETGDQVCKSPGYVPGFVPWADSHGLSYMGWTWNTWSDCSNILIKDYHGTPTAGYGTYFRDHLMALAKNPIQPVADPGSPSLPAGVPAAIPATGAAPTAASRLAAVPRRWKVGGLLAFVVLLGVGGVGLSRRLRPGRR